MLIIVDVQLQQIEIHQTGIQRQATHADTHVFGFQSFVSNQIMETILFIVMKSFGTVQRIDDEETATRAVVGTEEHLDEVHDGGTKALPGEIAAGTETTNEHGRETFECLVAQVGVIEKLLLILVCDAVSQADAVVREREGSDDGVGLIFEAEKVGLAKKFALVHETILGEKLVKVSLAATEGFALGQFIFRSANEVTTCQQIFYSHNAVQVFRKLETTFAS